MKKQLFIHDGNVYSRLSEREIYYIEVLGRVCHIRTEDHQFEISIPLKELLTSLNTKFIQVHRSYAVNIEKIENFDTNLLSLTIHGLKFNIGRSYKESFLDRIDRLG